MDPMVPLAQQLAAWDAETLTHRFTLAAATSDGTTVFAGDDPGGELDWHRFSLAGTAPALAGAPAPEHRTIRLTPTLLRVPGMPAERWWQLDDQVVDLGAIGAGATDLAPYVAPVRLPLAADNSPCQSQSSARRAPRLSGPATQSIKRCWRIVLTSSRMAAATSAQARL